MFAMLLLFLNLSHAASVHEINCVKESFSFEDGIVQSDHNETRSYNLSMGRDYIRLDSRVFMYSGLNKEGMKEYTYGKDILMYESGYLYIMRKLRTENVSYARCQLIEGRKQSI